MEQNNPFKEYCIEHDVLHVYEVLHKVGYRTLFELAQPELTVESLREEIERYNTTENTKLRLSDGALYMTLAAVRKETSTPTSRRVSNNGGNDSKQESRAAPSGSRGPTGSSKERGLATPSEANSAQNSFEKSTPKHKWLAHVREGKKEYSGEGVLKKLFSSICQRKYKDGEANEAFKNNQPPGKYFFELNGKKYVEVKDPDEDNGWRGAYKCTLPGCINELKPLSGLGNVQNIVAHAMSVQHKKALETQRMASSSDPESDREADEPGTEDDEEVGDGEEVQDIPPKNGKRKRVNLTEDEEDESDEDEDEESDEDEDVGEDTINELEQSTRSLARPCSIVNYSSSDEEVALASPTNEVAPSISSPSSWRSSPTRRVASGSARSVEPDRNGQAREDL